MTGSSASKVKDYSSEDEIEVSVPPLPPGSFDAAFCNSSIASSLQLAAVPWLIQAGQWESNHLQIAAVPKQNIVDVHGEVQPANRVHCSALNTSNLVPAQRPPFRPMRNSKTGVRAGRRRRSKKRRMEAALAGYKPSVRQDFEPLAYDIAGFSTPQHRR